MVNHKLCAPYFVTFQHSLLQLKCIWSSFSLELGSCCSFSQPFPVQITFLRQNCRFASGDLDHHLTHGSMGPPQSTSQMASQSVQLFFAWLTIVTDQPIDRQTDTPHYSVCNNRPHLHVVKHQCVRMQLRLLNAGLQLHGLEQYINVCCYNKRTISSCTVAILTNI